MSVDAPRHRHDFYTIALVHCHSAHIALLLIYSIYHFTYVMPFSYVYHSLYY